MKKDKISVVTPVYGCGEGIRELYSRLKDVLGKMAGDYEIIFVNDASPDNAWPIILELCNEDRKVKALNLLRNFGQHQAIAAGLSQASGDWVVVMDCDLQDQPEDIARLYNKAAEGYDVVFGRRLERKDSFFKRYTSILYHKFYAYFTEVKTDGAIANFCIFSSDVLRRLNALDERYRNHVLMINWLGYNQTSIVVEHARRQHGKSGYSFIKLVNLAIDTIVSQSNKPLNISIKLGFLMSFLSIMYACWLTVRFFIYSTPVTGWTSVMVSIYFVGGLILAGIGFLGVYLGKVFDEMKNRPLYIIREKINFD
jgi:dolichol-phosphate mannosyltransferase